MMEHHTRKEQDVFGGRHDWYYSDSYRVIANIGLDYEWFAADEWNVENNNKVQKFFCETHKDEEFKIYEIDGTVIEQPALHPVAMMLRMHRRLWLQTDLTRKNV